MTTQDLVAVINAAAVPLEIVAILVAVAYTGRTLGDQGAEVIIAVLGAQIAATVSYMSRSPYVMQPA